MPDVNLSPYTAQAAQIEQRRRMAEMLSQQSMQPLDTNQTAGGYVIPVSPFAGLAKMLQGYAGGVGQRKAGEEQKALAERYRGDQMGDMTALAKMLSSPGAPAQPEQWMSEGIDERLQPATAARAPGQIDPEMIGQFKTPEVTQLAMARMLAQKPQGPIAGDKPLIDPVTFQPVYTPPEKPKFHVVGGNLVPEPTATGQPVAPAFTAPEKPPEAIRGIQEAMRAAGIDPNSPQGQQFFANYVKKQTTHQPAPTQNVTVNTEKQLFGNIAETVGKDVATAAQNAKAALQTLNTVGQVREALDTGKVIAGPATTARMFLGQIGQVMGIAGKDATEQLTNTRGAIQGLAQLELDAAQQMRGQGQITEAERGIIRRAASGDIDSLTIPELRRLTDALDKTARYKIKANASNVARIKANPNSASLAEFMQVEEPPAYTPKRRAADKAGPKFLGFE